MDKADLIVWFIVGVLVFLSVIVAFVYKWMRKKEKQLSNCSDDEWGMISKKSSNRLAIRLMKSALFNELIQESTTTVFGISLLIFVLLLLCFI